MVDDEVPEEQLEAAEERPAHHHHDGLEPTEEALREHLVSAHRMDVPDRLSFSTMEGMHDRFHHDSHAADD